MSLNEEDTKRLQDLKELLLKGLKIIDDGAIISPPPVDPVDPTPVDPTEPIPIKPKEQGVILHGGWGGNPDPNTWKATKMVNAEYAGKWKIVDNKGVNILQEFSTEQNAKDMIAWAIANITNNPTDPTPDPVDPNPTPDPTEPPSDLDNIKGPYAKTPGSKTMQSTTRGPTTRHYASGKPDDETIEKNVKGITYKAYQWITKVKLTEMEHEDNISLKSGGNHDDGPGWYDNGINSHSGQTCIGVEPAHPETHLCEIKGRKVGNVVGKWVESANVYFAKENKIEYWTKIEGIDTEWHKDCEGVGVRGLKPKFEDDDEAQLRIDGFVKDEVPEIAYAVIQEIAPLP
jgi:hypothetical protein